MGDDHDISMDMDMDIEDSSSRNNNNNNNNRLFLPSLDPLYSTVVPPTKLTTYSPSRQITQLQFHHPDTGALEVDTSSLVVWLLVSPSSSSSSSSWAVWFGPNSKYNVFSSSSSTNGEVGSSEEVKALDKALDVIRGKILKEEEEEEEEKTGAGLGLGLGGREMITQIKIVTASEEIVDGFGLGLVGEAEAEAEGEKGKGSLYGGEEMRKVWGKLEELEFGEEVGGVGVEFWGLGHDDDDYHQDEDMGDVGEGAREGAEIARREMMMMMMG